MSPSNKTHAMVLSAFYDTENTSVLESFLNFSDGFLKLPPTFKVQKSKGLSFQMIFQKKSSNLMLKECIHTL